MLDVAQVPQSRTVFFDNLFTGYELLVHLRNIGFQATGTMRKNRLNKCPLKGTNEMKKQKRGSYDYRVDTKEEILIVKWLDNKYVIVGTNYDTVEPIGKVQRWQRDKKARGLVPQPNALKN